MDTAFNAPGARESVGATGQDVLTDFWSASARYFELEDWPQDIQYRHTVVERDWLDALPLEDDVLGEESFL